MIPQILPVQNPPAPVQRFPMPAPSSKKAKKQRDLREWVGPATPAAPPRPSQVVQESTSLSPEGRHIEVVMERVSTGGTRHQAHFRRSALTPMTGQERMAKNRARKSLFAEQAAGCSRSTTGHRAQAQGARACQGQRSRPVARSANGGAGIRGTTRCGIAKRGRRTACSGGFPTRSQTLAIHWLLVRRRLRRQV